MWANPLAVSASAIMKLARTFGRVRLKYLVPLVFLLYLSAEYLGLFLHLREKDFFTEFSWPLEGTSIKLHSWASSFRSGREPEVRPINKHDYLMLTSAKGKCIDEDNVHYVKLRLVYVVKSAVDHFERRAAIRRTWGYEHRFSDVPIRTVFLLGSTEDEQVQSRVAEEYANHKDLVQGSFTDSYFNNTIKTMMGLRWTAELCPTSRFYFFVDDDYYVSTRNALRFLRNPVNYPHYLEEPVLSFDDDKLNVGRKPLQLVDFDLPEDVNLYAGHVFHTAPHRHRSSKWFVTLDEYPFHLWPPYVTAGAYVLSKQTMEDMYYASPFVRRFRFDDVFLGLVSKKLGTVEPFHCQEFHFTPKPYHRVSDYQYVVASHGYSNPKQLEWLWNQQKAAGNA